jgi:hypothetical protein
VSTQGQKRTYAIAKGPLPRVLARLIYSLIPLCANAISSGNLALGSAAGSRETCIYWEVICCNEPPAVDRTSRLLAAGARSCDLELILVETYPEEQGYSVPARGRTGRALHAFHVRRSATARVAREMVVRAGVDVDKL